MQTGTWVIVDDDGDFWWVDDEEYVHAEHIQLPFSKNGVRPRFIMETDGVANFFKFYPLDAFRYGCVAKEVYFNVNDTMIFV